MSDPAFWGCVYCGTEIIWGAAASTLDRELSLCPACPSTPSEREAIARGVADGRRSACSEPAPPFTMPGSGYAFASPEYTAAKRGWWAGHWAEQVDHDLDFARYALLATIKQKDKAKRLLALLMDAAEHEQTAEEAEEELTADGVNVAAILMRMRQAVLR